MMDQWKLWFVLLLLLQLCFDTEVKTIVKTIIGRESDVTPICSSAPLHTITLIVCKISTKRNRKECHLLYQFGQEFENGCYSRLRLIKENRTVFLSLTGLTSGDSGSYSCECSHAGGTETLYLNITVEGDKEAITSFISPTVIVGVTVFIIVSGLFLGLLLRKNHCRDHTRSGPPELPESETPWPLDEDDLHDPYTSLQLPASDLYQTISSMRYQFHTNTFSASNNITMAQSDDQEINERETDGCCDIYENI